MSSPHNDPSIGATASVSIVVQRDDLASALAMNGDIDRYPTVLATPRLIALMEIASARLLQPVLGPEQVSVGVRVEVSHSLPTPQGATVTANARYLGRRKSYHEFCVTASDEHGEVASGIHQRAVVSLKRLQRSARMRVNGKDSNL